MEPLPILIVLAIALLLFPLKNATFCVKKVVTICVNFTFYILVTTLRVYVRFCVSCCISGVTHDNYFRRHWRDRLGSRSPQVGVFRVSRTFSPGTKTLFFKCFTLNAFPVFLAPQSACESHDNIWNLPFWGTRKPKVY